MIRAPERSKESKEREDKGWCFKMYLEFCFYSEMVRPTYQEMVASEKVVYYSFIKRRGAQHTTRNHTVSTRISQEAEGVRGKSGKRLSLWF